MDSTPSSLHHDYPLSLLIGIVAFTFVTALIARGAFSLNSCLNSLPGPFISRFSRLQLKYETLMGRRAFYIENLHRSYGPIVRVAPNEISVITPEAVQQLYRIGAPFCKTEFYNNFGSPPPEPRSLFGEQDRKRHLFLRRLRGNEFSHAGVLPMEPLIQRQTQLTIECMKEQLALSGYIDIYQWFLFMATDIVGEASFGESFHMLRDRKQNQYSEDLQLLGPISTLIIEAGWVLDVARRLGVGKKYFAIFRRMNEYSSQSIDRYRTKMLNDPEYEANSQPTLLAKAYKHCDAGSTTETELKIDARSNIVAGTDTTATAATQIVWLLAQHPDVERELIEQLATLPADFDDETISKAAPFLDKVIKEALRLKLPISWALPRRIPAQGAKFEGYALPPNAIIGIPGYSIHRNPDIWGLDADTFDPHRWDHPTPDMIRCFVPFGGGNRVCVGMHFALLELRHAIAIFYATFRNGVRPSSAKGFVAKEMDVSGHFLDSPKGKRCLVEPRL